MCQNFACMSFLFCFNRKQKCINTTWWTNRPCWHSTKQTVTTMDLLLKTSLKKSKAYQVNQAQALALSLTFLPEILRRKSSHISFLFKFILVYINYFYINQRLNINFLNLIQLYLKLSLKYQVLTFEIEGGICKIEIIPFFCFAFQTAFPIILVIYSPTN